MADPNVSYPVLEPLLPADAAQNNTQLNPSQLLSGTLPGSTVIQIGSNNLFIDGGNQNFRVNDGNYDRVVMGRIAVNPNNYGLVVRDAAGNIIFDASGSTIAVSITSITGTSGQFDTFFSTNFSADYIKTGTLDASGITVTNLSATSINTGSLNGSLVGSGVSGGNLTSASVTGTQIANSTITAGKLSVSSLDAITATIGTVNSGTITGSSYDTNKGTYIDGGGTHHPIWIHTDLNAINFNIDSTSFGDIGFDHSNGYVVVDNPASPGSGNFHVTGTLTKGSGSFDIEHPTKKGYRLRYPFIEGPETLLISRGKRGEQPPQHFIDVTEPDSWQTITDSETGNWVTTAVRLGFDNFVNEYKGKYPKNYKTPSA